NQLRELQVGYQVQLEETNKQRQRELVDLLQGGQDALSSAQREGFRQVLDTGQDRYSKLLQLQTQLFEKQREQQTQYHEGGQRAQQQWFEQAQTLIRRNHETLTGLAEGQHQQSELLERDLHEQIQSLQRQHFTILKQLQDQNHNQVQSLQNSLQEKTEQLIRQLNADAQRSLSAEFRETSIYKPCKTGSRPSSICPRISLVRPWFRSKTSCPGLWKAATAACSVFPWSPIS
ncbi:MAG: hypothetical protein EBW58_05675, partial [Betaproteobacteria bacterium]|nr:hypothetical protein [Betaproteobacteria bacterium]